MRGAESVLSGDPWKLQVSQTREVHSNFVTSPYGFPVAFLVTSWKTGAVGNLLLLPYQ